MGRTGIEISDLAFGASPLGRVRGVFGERDGIDAVRTALDLGVTFFDVSPYYGATRAETVLGKALHGVDRAGYALATKVIVLDHLGKPSPSSPGASWRQAVGRLARSGNVVCKLSGLATEAAPGTGPEPLLALLREALQTFGPDRCLYGGDWPVMTLATSYPTWLDLVRAALAGFPADAADAVLRANAIRTYRLDRAAPASRHPSPEEPA
nr:aldo/keto reductase [Streptomyces sp. SID4948]